VVAVARVHGPAAGLDALAALESDRRMATYHRLLATRAHLLGLTGQHGPAAAAYRDARGGPPACPSAAISAGWRGPGRPGGRLRVPLARNCRTARRAHGRAIS